MASAKCKNLLQDTSGAVMVEFTAAATVFLLLLFGSVEFANLFYQWNAATKAVQWGARVAAVSDPVASNLKTLIGTEDGTTPGVVSTANYDCTCGWDQATTTMKCSGSVPTGAIACTYDAAALQTLVFGRGANGAVYQTCQTSPANIGMCNLFPGLALENVTVEYKYTRLGYAGRPGSGGNTGGPVPTITVSLHQRVIAVDPNVLKFQFVLIGGLMKIGNTAFTGSIDMPSFATTVTGEDLAKAGS